MSIGNVVKRSELIIRFHFSKVLILNLSVSKTDSFYEYIDKRQRLATDPDNLFGTVESSIGLYIADYLVKEKLVSGLSVYQTNLVLYIELEKNTDLIYLVSKITSEATLCLNRLYPNPKLVPAVFLPPREELITFQRYWQMCWFAHLRRCLGEIYEPHISKQNKKWSVKELQAEFEKDPRFSWNSLSPNLKYGYQYERGKLVERNFCRGTAGDLHT